MKCNYVNVMAVLSFLFGIEPAISQSSGPQFLSCSDEPVSLCVQDEGVRLPANNQYYVGEDHPDAISGSVHVARHIRVKSECGLWIQYHVEVFVHDTSAAIMLVNSTTVEVDTTGEVELNVDTEQAADAFIRQQGLPYGTGCMPFHRIRWTVTDSCGNEVICETRIRLYDCFLPTSEEIEGFFTYTFPIGCLLTMFAVDLVVKPLDDTSPREDMLFSFSPTQYKPTIALTNCDVPALGVVIPWEVWIMDAGLDVNCDGRIEWDERHASRHETRLVFMEHGYCCCLGGEKMEMLQGKIHNAPDGEGIPLVHVSFIQPMQFYPTYVTDDSGDYQIVPVTPTVDMPLTIRPSRDDHHRLGVSTLDLVKIQKHLLGIEPLSGPYKHIAADINNSHSVSAIDLVELRKLLLGRYTEFPNNTSWRFVREDFVFPDTMDPWMGMSWSMPPSFQEIVLTELDTLHNLNFIGVKIGDITGAYDPNLTSGLEVRSASSVFQLHAKSSSFVKGQLVDIPIFAPAESELTGFQFTLTHSGLELIAVEPGQLEIGEDEIAMYEDHTTMSWFVPHAQRLQPDIPIFTLTFVARASGITEQVVRLTSDITEAEWYSTEDLTMRPILVFSSNQSGSHGLSSFVTPNPWSNYTVINCTLPAPGEVRLIITDVLGRIMFDRREYAGNTDHAMAITSEDLPWPGQYFYKVLSAGQQVSGILVRLTE